MKILNDIMFDGEQFGHLMVKLVFDWIFPMAITK
jgi:hypothetical protein